MGYVFFPLMSYRTVIKCYNLLVVHNHFSVISHTKYFSAATKLAVHSSDCFYQTQCNMETLNRLNCKKLAFHCDDSFIIVVV